MRARRPATLSVVGQQRVGGAGESDGFGGEVRAFEIGSGAGGVALVEDEIEDVEHGAEALGALFGGGRLKADAGGLDGGFGAGDALCHGGFGHQEGAGDLGCGEAADGAQRERDGGRRSERGMAAHEEKVEGVVLRVALEVEVRDDEEGLFGRGGGFAIEAGTFTAHAIGHAAGGDADEPGARVLRSAFVRPLGGGGDQ